MKKKTVTLKNYIMAISIFLIALVVFLFFIPVYSIRSQKILRSEFLQMCHVRVSICGQYLILIIST